MNLSKYIFTRLDRLRQHSPKQRIMNVYLEPDIIVPTEFFNSQITLSSFTVYRYQYVINVLMRWRLLCVMRVAKSCKRKCRVPSVVTCRYFLCRIITPINWKAEKITAEIFIFITPQQQ